jgi:toxin ParE1/3/4
LGNKYDIIIEEQAQEDLRGIFKYVSDVLMAPETAANLVQRIREAVSGLEKFPERYPLYDREPWRSRGVRRMNIENFAAFYVVVKAPNIVSVLAVIYGGRDIDNVLVEKLGE